MLDSPLAFMATFCGGLSVAAAVGGAAALWTRHVDTARALWLAAAASAALFIGWLLLAAVILAFGGAS